MHYTQIFDPEKYIKEFQEFYVSVEVTDRNPLHTEMFYLWCMIRELKPQLFIESGTFRGYSAHIICEALSRNPNSPEFITIGYNLENCLEHARNRLKPYRFARVIEGDSRKALSSNPVDSRSTAFFIDGPKGSNMYPLFMAIEKKFRNPLFIAVHDVESEATSGSRQAVLRFWKKQYPVVFCDNEFQLRYQELDRPLIGKYHDGRWKPFYHFGKKRRDYGTATAYVLANQHSALKGAYRTAFNVYRFIRFVALKGIV